MSSHDTLVMSFDNSNWFNLFRSLNQFWDYMYDLVKHRDQINFCYIGTAGRDSKIERIFFNLWTKFKFGFKCKTTYLDFTNKYYSQSELTSIIMSQSIVFVGGGNTQYMLQMWRACGFEEVLEDIYHQNSLPIMAGVSAGGMYHFDVGLSDYLPGYLTALNCYSLLPYSFCAHADNPIKLPAPAYTENGTRREVFNFAINHDFFPSGYALDNDTMLHFKAGELVNQIKSRDSAKIEFIQKARL